MDLLVFGMLAGATVSAVLFGLLPSGCPVCGRRGLAWRAVVVLLRPRREGGDGATAHGPDGPCPAAEAEELIEEAEAFLRRRRWGAWDE